MSVGVYKRVWCALKYLVGRESQSECISFLSQSDAYTQRGDGLDTTIWYYHIIMHVVTYIIIISEQGYYYDCMRDFQGGQSKYSISIMDQWKRCIFPHPIGKPEAVVKGLLSSLKVNFSLKIRNVHTYIPIFACYLYDQYMHSQPENKTYQR